MHHPPPGGIKLQKGIFGMACHHLPYVKIRVQGLSCRRRMYVNPLAIIVDTEAQYVISLDDVSIIAASIGGTVTVVFVAVKEYHIDV